MRDRVSRRSPAAALKPINAASLAAMLAAASTAWAAPTPQTQTSPPSPIIQSYARAILTDITVWDRNWDPVLGLPSSNFRVTDNGVPQTITYFREHAEWKTQAASVELKDEEGSGVYDNSYLEHLPPSLNIVVVDLSTFSFEDAGYVWYELNRFIEHLTANQQIAIYVRTDSDLLLLQPFTADRALLLAAAHNAISRFALNFGVSRPSSLFTLHAIASEFAGLPGRKSVLWFEDRAQGLGLSSSLPDSPPDARRVFERLQAERIAIYPISVAGVTPFLHLGMRTVMEAIAEATGGRAFDSDNGLDAIAEQIVTTDGDYYTLSYDPVGVAFENSWHQVDVTLTGRGQAKFHLRYRQNYFASNPESQSPANSRDGHETSADAQPVPSHSAWAPSILFKVVLTPAASTAPNQRPAGNLLPSSPQKPRKGATPFLVRYEIPSNQLTLTQDHGMANAQIGVQVVVLNETGNILDHNADYVSLRRSQADIKAAPQIPIQVEQSIWLPKGYSDLFCMVWDTSSHHTGSVEIPYSLKK